MLPDEIRTGAVLTKDKDKKDTGKTVPHSRGGEETEKEHPY